MAVHAVDAPERVRRASRLLLVVLVLQAAVGYTQYFTHLPAAVVELHIAGATALVVGTLQFFLALTWHPREPIEPTPHQAAQRVPPDPAREGAVLGS